MSEGFSYLVYCRLSLVWERYTRRETDLLIQIVRSPGEIVMIGGVKSLPLSVSLRLTDRVPVCRFFSPSVLHSGGTPPFGGRSRHQNRRVPPPTPCSGPPGTPTKTQRQCTKENPVGRPHPSRLTSESGPVPYSVADTESPGRSRLRPPPSPQNRRHCLSFV